MSGGIRLGTQGWNYPAWVGSFYPLGTRPKDFLELYSRAFDTVEVDSTFYASPPASTVRGWASRTPPGFLFSLKMPREITHERRLVGSEEVLAEFVDRARELEDRLGPILIQLGPDFSPLERRALEEFLPLLPPDLEFAVEFRQAEWIRPWALDLLSAHRVALAISDGRWIPRGTALELVSRPTAAFHYLRWMGADRSITDYSRTQLDRSAELDAWGSVLGPVAGGGVRVFGYVNNHFAGHSPATARQLQRLLGGTPVEPDSIGDQIPLF